MWQRFYEIEHEAHVSRGHRRHVRRKMYILKTFRGIKRLNFPRSEFPHVNVIIFPKFHPAFLCPLGRDELHFFSSFQQRTPFYFVFTFNFTLHFSVSLGRAPATGAPSVCRMIVSIEAVCSPSEDRYVISILQRLYRIHNHQHSLSRYGQLITICLYRDLNEFGSCCLAECFHHSNCS